MLTQYSLDTNDEDLYPRAVELRKRYAGRKLQEAIDRGIVDDKLLVKLKDLNRQERRQHGSEVVEIMAKEEDAKVTLVRTEQQLGIQSKLRTLGNDVTRATRLGKSRMDTLTDLEKRIIKMRDGLNKPAETPTVEHVMIDALSVNNKYTLEKMFTRCELCKRNVLSTLFDVHSKSCAKLGGQSATDFRPPVYDVDVDLKTSLTTCVPQPPRNCKYVRKGHRFVEFSWEPPVFDGGLPVTNYEIAYKTHTAYMDKVSKLRVVKVTEQPNILTSNWCFRNPVCHNGYKIVNLTAGQSYVDFQVRSINLQGPSEWVDLVQKGGPTIITTSEGVYPWCPLFIHVVEVTSTCIHLDWSPPLFDGGNDITHYEINYVVVERHVTSTSRAHMVSRERTIVTKNNECRFVIRNLPTSTKVHTVNIRAVNASDKRGAPGYVTWGEKVNTTQPCSRYFDVQHEIDRVLALDGDFVDTDFYTGVVQKLYKKDYIGKLYSELAMLAPTELEAAEAAEWKKITDAIEEEKRQEELALKMIQGDDSSDEDEHGPREIGAPKKSKKKVQNFEFPYKTRKKHFKLKIISLDNDIQSLEREKVQIEIDRVNNTTLLKDRQIRLNDLQHEKDRVQDYQGEQITSNVLQGVMMTYLITNFRHALETAWSACLAEIAAAKFSIIKGEKRKREIARLLDNRKNEKKTRQAKMNAFMSEYEKQQRLVSNLVGGSSRFSLLRSHFDKILRFVIEQKETKTNVRLAFSTCIRRFLASAFEKWARGKFSTDVSSADFEGGAGTAMLQNARKMREEVQASLRDVLASTSEIVTKLKVGTLPQQQSVKLMTSEHLSKMEEGMSQSYLSSDGGMKFLFEGDGLLMDNKYAQAESCYDAQIITLRSRQPVNIKYLAICHGRMGKLFLKMERWDRAIVDFDRQMSLANEIGDKVEAADAFYGLGAGYLGRFDYLEAVRYLEIAQSRYELLGNIPKHCGCLVSMKECYQRLGKDELAKLYAKRISVIENELRTKLNLISEKLTDMTQRLRLNAAAFEMEVKIERITSKTIGLRAQLEMLHDRLDDENEELEKQQSVCGGIEGLLQAIQEELNEAASTDDLEMMSSLVHDRPQMVNVEEVKTRLHVRRLGVLEDYKREKDMEAAIQTRIKNTEDEIAACDDELLVEQGQLMHKVKHSRPFRAIAFNPANAASDEVTGLATGGVENFACAESSNIHVIDYHNGELLQLFAGDDRSRLGDKEGHTGVITCLAYDQNRVYSGSADETIMIWDMLSRKRVNVLRGHDGTIVALAVHSFMLMSGGSDATIRLWDKNSGKELRVITGHSESVLSIDLGATWMVTSSVDEEVRVWEIRRKSKHTIKVDTKFRLAGHECPVTCAKYGKLEVVSGDRKGNIIIWWLETGEIIRRVENVHKGKINCIQFDATRIVTGGSDNNVCVVDIGTGTVLQTLRGHTNQVVYLAFDTERIISASRDSTLRYWKWGEKRHAPADKYHVMDKGDTLPFVSRNYDLTLQDLMKWNGIKEVRDCYPGMRLIVRKANPDQLTKAELAEFDKERKRLKGQAQTNAKIKQIQMERGSLFARHSRVYKLATDIDPYSLGNRMFRKQKVDSELFPEKDEMYIDQQSLGQRIKSNTGSGPQFNTVGVRFFATKANEDEWGHISDELGTAMLDTFIEFMAYELVKDEKRKIRDHLSVLGRMQMAPSVKAENTRQMVKKQESVGSVTNRGVVLPPIEWKSSFGYDMDDPARSKMSKKAKKNKTKNRLERERLSDEGEWMESSSGSEEGDNDSATAGEGEDEGGPAGTYIENCDDMGKSKSELEDYGLIGFGGGDNGRDGSIPSKEHDIAVRGNTGTVQIGGGQKEHLTSSNSSRHPSLSGVSVVSSGQVQHKSSLDVDEEDSDFLSLMKSSVVNIDDGDY